MKTIDTPWGTVVVDENIPRILCRNCQNVMIPTYKANGLCHGCTHRCGKAMPLARQYCARGAGHRGGCRTRETMDAEADAKSQRGARGYVGKLA